MPLLGPDSPLPARPNRVLVAGASGSGKTTTVRLISEGLGLPAVELDALFHGPQWIPRPSFVDDVKAFADTPEWVCEWQYSAVRPLLAERADLVVWLDHPRATIARRVLVRTVRRRLAREELWNGNTEAPLSTIFTDREHVVRWAMSTYGRRRADVRGLLRRPRPVVVRLHGQRQVDNWFRGPFQAVAESSVGA